MTITQIVDYQFSDIRNVYTVLNVNVECYRLVLNMCVHVLSQFALCITYAIHNLSS